MASFEKDLFISYSHIDNETLSQEQEGWISRFHATLEALTQDGKFMLYEKIMSAMITGRPRTIRSSTRQRRGFRKDRGLPTRWRRQASRV